MKLSAFDIFTLAVLTWFVVRTAWIGAVRGLSSLLAMVLGFVLSGRIQPVIKGILKPWLGQMSWFDAVSWVTSFVLVFLAVFLLAEVVVRLLEVTHLSFLDRLLGAVLGFLKASILLSIVFFFVITFYPGGERVVKESKVAPVVLKTTRIMVELIPSELKREFNYRWRRIFKDETLKKNLGSE